MPVFPYPIPVSFPFSLFQWARIGYCSHSQGANPGAVTMLIAKLCQKSRNPPLINEIHKKKRNSHCSLWCWVVLLTGISALGCIAAPHNAPFTPCRMVNATLVKSFEASLISGGRAAFCLEAISFNYFDRHLKIAAGKLE